MVPKTMSGEFVSCDVVSAHAARMIVEGVKSLSIRQATWAISCVRAKLAFGWNVTDGRAGNWGASREAKWEVQNAVSASLLRVEMCLTKEPKG